MWSSTRENGSEGGGHAKGSSGALSAALGYGTPLAAPAATPVVDSCGLAGLLLPAVKQQQEVEEMTLSNLTSASAGEASVSSGNRTDGTTPGMPPTSTPATPATTTATVSSGQPLAVKRKRNLPGTPGMLHSLSSFLGHSKPISLGLSCLPHLTACLQSSRGWSRSFPSSLPSSPPYKSAASAPPVSRFDTLSPSLRIRAHAPTQETTRDVFGLDSGASHDDVITFLNHSNANYPT